MKCQQEPKRAALLINLSYNNDINRCFKYPQEWAVAENIYTLPHGWLWRNPGFLLGFFQEGEAKKFLRGTSSKFSEANHSGGEEGIFLKRK